MSASEGAKPVALLARPGPARERLRAALAEAGAWIVLEEDPNLLSADAIAGAGAEAVLVALEPAVEDALAGLGAALEAPGVRLIFDEAGLAAERQGWAAQRWARHLAAKLYGHDDVLPPGREAEAYQPSPGLPPTPAQLQAGASIEPHLQEAEARAAALPSDGLAMSIPGLPGILQDEPEAWTPRDPSTPPDSYDWEAVELPAPVPEPLPAGSHHSRTTLEAAAAGASPETAAGAPARSPWRLELEALQPQVAAGEGIGGAVLVAAGIGGPDAIRKLLGALSPGFGRPLLLKLRLDGGRYDNLVKQMSRVSPLPVVLAEADQPLRPGTVYVLPDEVGVMAAHGAMTFVARAGNDDIITALPPAESAVLMLSGSDPALVEDALALSTRGGFVAAQSSEGCYDPAAANALAARGVERDTPAGLAQRLAQRW